MRHARPAALDELEPLLVRVRELDALVERTRGVFYLRSKAFLHFHEDPSGLHADVRLSTEFERFRVETQAERIELLKMIEHSLGLHVVVPDGELLRHGYTNSVIGRGDVVVKTYRGSDAAARRDREVLAITSLTGRLPVAPLVASTSGGVVLGKVPGRHGQDLIELGQGDAVMFALGRLLRQLQAIEPSFYSEYDGDGVLVHGDFGPNNVLLAEEDDSVALLADWEWSSIGDPTTDLAWAEFIVRMHHPHHLECLPALFDGYGRRPSWSERKTTMTDRAGVLETWVRSWQGDDAAEWDRRSQLISQWEELA